VKILIVKTSSIGDVLHTFPVLSYLRKRFPAAQIDWAVEKGCAELLHGHPQLSRMLVLDSRVWRKTLFSKKTRLEISEFFRTLREEEYDLLIDLQGNSKSALVTLSAKAKEKVGFGWNALPEKPNWLVTTHRYNPPENLSVRERNLHLVQSHFQDFTAEEFSSPQLKISEAEEVRLVEILSKMRGERLMICFGSKWRNKQLGEETLFPLVKKIEERLHPAFLFIWGSETEKRLADKLHELFPRDSQSIGELSLSLWQALMAKMQGVLAVDSAALHLCATTETPTFSIFGPSSSAYYKPEGEEHQCVQGECPYGQIFEKRCQKLRSCPTGACVRNLKVETLFARFNLWWQKRENRYDRSHDF